jgi:Tfp pilus assembly protein PilO
MRSSDRAIVIGVAVVGLAVALWFGVVKPKRDEVSKLDAEIATLSQDVAAAEALATEAELAQEGYDRNYHRLVVLGKAVPGEADSSSLLIETDGLAAQAGIEFRDLTLGEGAAAESDAAAAQTTADPPAEGQIDPGGTSEPATAPAPPTEAAAASLPIGATVGPGGLPVMPYDLNFRGDFFDIADFLAGLDSLVKVSAEGPGVDGRLITVDGFALTADPDKGFPRLNADLHVTTFVAPADQGLTAGATAAAPAATTPAPAPAPATEPVEATAP